MESERKNVTRLSDQPELKEKKLAGDGSESDLRRLACDGYPPHLRDLITRSEVLSVQRPEQYNWEKRLDSGSADDSRSAARGIRPQLAAREEAPDHPAPNVVTLRLKEPQPATQVHRVDADGTPRLGQWFAERGPDHATPLGSIEAFALDPRTPSKTHESWGFFTSGSVVCLSEASARSYTLKSVSESDRSDGILGPVARPGENPMLTERWKEPRFQFELVGDPHRDFIIRGTRKLGEDDLH